MAVKLTKPQLAQLKNEYDSIYSYWSVGKESIMNYIPGNRDTQNTHINSISKSIVETTLIQDPVMVATRAYNQPGDNNYYLYNLDGQHRVLACEKIGRSFNYKIIRVDSTVNIAHMLADANNKVKRWTSANFIKHFSFDQVVGVHYIELTNIIRKHEGHSPIQIANLLHHGNLTHRRVDMIKNGTFQCVYKQEAEEALAIFDLIEIYGKSKLDNKKRKILKTIGFRSSFLEFVNKNKTNLDLKEFIKSFANSLVQINELPVNSGEWWTLLNRHYNSI
jgi:hypothetical protein